MPDSYRVTIGDEEYEVDADSVEDARAKAQAAARVPARAEAGANDQLLPIYSALSKAETIGETPWYERRIGPLPSVTQAMSALPAAGGLLGGIVGGGAGLATGPGAVLGAVKGAALGGAGGEALRQLAFRAAFGTGPSEPIEAIRDIAKESATQAGMELAGQGLMRGASRLLRPAAAALDRPVVQAARRQGVELPASALSKSKAVAHAEGWAGGGPFGGEIGKRAGAAVQRMTDLADLAVRNASKATTDTARGEAIAKGLDLYRSQWMMLKNKLYGNARIPRLPMTAPKTLALLDEIAARKAAAGDLLKGGPVADRGLFEGLREGLTKPPPPPMPKLFGPDGQLLRRMISADDGGPRTFPAAHMQAAIKELNAKLQGSFADAWSAENKQLLKKLAATMREELDTAIRSGAPDIAAKLDLADRVYRHGVTKLQSAFGQDITRLAKNRQYDLIAKRVVRPSTSVEDIPRIFEVAGPEGTDAIRASVLADIIGKAKGPEGLTPRGIFNGMKSYGDARLRAILLPQQYAKLRDLSTLSTAMPRLAKTLAGSPTAGNLRLGGYTSAGTSALLGHPQALAFLVGDPLFNKFIASKVGQRWLTTGFELAPAAAKALRQAPRAGGAAYRMQQQERQKQQSLADMLGEGE